MNNLSDRQKQIINVSINIISKNGIQNLTMKNLSREIGITEPAIYRHFESKQKILIAILESFKHQNKLINENIQNEGDTAFQHLQRTIEMIMKKLDMNPAMSSVIFSEETFQNQSELSDMVKSIMHSTIA
ncbi:MAG: TetR/AcrR family transcriptional regulator, partial [Spirochaetota bacterium]|nr:TetR/AcrR family transcriptional regulator [Spirochaetota bacterium]